VIFVGGAGSQGLTVTSDGAADVVLELELTSAHTEAYTVGIDQDTLASGESAAINLALVPADWGSHDATLKITDSATGDFLPVSITASVQVDSDGDGYGSAETGGDDCVDDDATINPGMEETWYDGIDTNCDGANDYDQDGDGSLVEDDCDDLDPQAYPFADEIWYDGVDQDCLGGDDFDQDADGYPLDDDCDDTDSLINPGAEETWYDGVDQDCDGADDFDQDGDGSTVDADCDDTNPEAYPGADEIWYDGIDEACDGGNDYDQDGDGVDYPTDCNDTDPTITGPEDEVWDGIDNDCSGVIDDFSINDLYSGYVTGTSSATGLGNYQSMSMGGDLTGDGIDDVALGTTSGGYGSVFVIPGDDLPTAAGAATSYDSATVTGSYYYYLVGIMAGPSADTNGDGTADLLTTGAYSTYGVAWLFNGAPSTTTTSSVDTYFVGDSDQDGVRISASADLDGDGFAEVLVGGPLDNYYSGSESSTRDAGSVAIFSSASGFGEGYDFGDADARLYGSTGYDYVGTTLAVGDWDGDGYPDIATGATGMDDGASGGGAVYLVSGDASLSWGGDRMDDIYTTRVLGTTSSGALGGDQLGQPGDLDGNGSAELVVSSEALGKVWVFWDSQTGDQSDTDAAATLSGTAGDFGSAVVYDTDFTGDGAADLLIGDDGNDTASSNAGAVWLFP
jgi:hypothetical protein